MNILKRGLTLCLALACTTMFFTSCDSDTTTDGDTTTDTDTSTSDDTTVDEVENIYGDYIIKLDGVEISFDEYRYYFQYMKSYMDSGDETYWTTYPDDIETLKEVTLEQLQYSYSTITLAEEKGVEITEEHEANVAEEIVELEESMGGEEALLEAMEASFLTMEVYENMAYQAQLQNEIIKLEYGDSVLEYANSEYVHASHILIAFPDDATDDDKAEILAQAEAVLEKVEAGEDFVALIEEYGEDSGQDAEEGYYFVEGDMVDSFYQGAVALEEDQTSGLIESEYGYHIIKRLAIEEDYLYSDIVTFLTDEQIDEINGEAEAIVEAMEIEYCDNYDDIGIDTM